MRIGLFTDTFPPDVNGVANSTYILYKELIKNGHEAFVVATGRDDNTGWDDEHRVYRLGGVEFKHLYGYVITSPIHMRAINEIRKLNLDIMHIQTEFGIGIFGHICARQLGIPVVSTYHTIYEDYTHYANFLNLDNFDNVAKKLVAQFSKIYENFSEAVIVPSEKTKELLKKYKVETDIFIIPTGLELSSFDPEKEDKEETKKIRSSFGFNDTDKIICYVGRIAQEKALDIAIKGISEAIDKGSNIKMMIVGGGPDEDKLKDLVNSLNKNDSIKFVGKVPSSEVVDYYRASNAFVSASLSETQGMTFIEALASGIPLFARYDDVLEDILIDNKTGWYYKDEHDLCDKVMAFSSINDDEYKVIKQNCLEQVKPYRSEVFYEKVFDVYSNVLEDYSSLSTVEDIDVKNEYVNLYIKTNQGEDIKLVVSLDDYYYEGIRKGGKLANRRIEELQKKEIQVKAYQSCIRRITAKDRTRKEIYDWLTRKTECDEDAINEIINKLEVKGYINDERYVEDAIARMHLSLRGEKYIINDLKRRGISPEMIENKLNTSLDNELENAKEFVQKNYNSIKGESVRGKKQKLKTRLLQRGYSSNIADEAILSLDFSNDEAKELDNLKKCAIKAKNRYMKKYQGTKLRNTVYRYCASQGYNNEDIYVILDEMEWNDD